MFKKNIAIIGPNKTVNARIGKKLADALAMHYLDAEEYLEYETDMLASFIVSDYGADFFYQLENSTLKKLKNYDNTVIVTSGTTLMTPDNIATLGTFSYLVLLTADRATVLGRLQKDDVILKDDIVAKKELLFYNIDSIYRMQADIILNTADAPPATLMKRLMRQLEKLVRV